MQIFKKTPTIDFLKFQKLAALISIILILAGVIGLFTKGLRLGIDFQGGINVQIQFEQKVEITQIRNLLSPALGNELSVTYFGSQANNEFLISIPKTERFTKRKLY